MASLIEGKRSSGALARARSMACATSAGTAASAGNGAGVAESTAESWAMGSLVPHGSTPASSSYPSTPQPN